MCTEQNSHTKDVEFEAFCEEVVYILPLETHRQESINKSRDYLQIKIYHLEYAKTKFKKLAQLEQIQLAITELTEIQNSTTKQNFVISFNTFRFNLPSLMYLIIFK